MGVGITGFVSWEFQNDKHKMSELRSIVREAGRSMALDLDMPMPKASQQSNQVEHYLK